MSTIATTRKSNRTLGPSTRNRRRMALLIAVAAGVGLWAGAQQAGAAVIVWDGSESSTWTNGANWVDGVAPGTSDIARFDGGWTSAPGAGLQIAGIQIGSNNPIMTIASTLALNIGVVNGVAILVESGAGATTFSGPPRFAGTQSWRNNSSSLLTIAGNWPRNNVLNLTIDGTGTGGTTINGPIVNDNHGATTVTVNAHNSITTFATGVTHTYTGATTVNSGTLLVNGTLNTQTSAVTVGGDTATGAPTLGGTGTINRPVTIAAAGGGAAGTLAPGAAGTADELKVTGAVAFESGSTFQVDVSGATADRLTVTGAVTLDSSSALDVVGTLTEKTYTVLTATSVTGEFDPASAPSGYVIAYTPTGAPDTVTLEKVPAGMILTLH